MAIDIQEFINSSLGISLIASLGRLIPVRLGYWLAGFAARRIVSHPESPLVRAVRANQWVVSGEKLQRPALDQVVGETFINSARSIFDLYHYSLSPAAIKRLITFDPGARLLTQRPEFDGRGLVVAGMHLSSFDLVLRALTLQGMRPLILTLPDPHGSQRVEYEMRKRFGMNLVPTSFGALRQALRHLERGGAVLTGIDRPIPDSKYHPQFFGRPADVPIHHVYLAAKAHVPVMVMVTMRQPDGKNHVMTSEPIEMEPCSDPDEELMRNAEKILRVGESYIRQAPRQWGMTLPVWPAALGMIPG